MKVNNHIQKLCCFYASDWHLTVMLLPYIDKMTKADYSIYMRCENDIEEKMHALLEKLELKNKHELMDLNWNNLVAEDNDVKPNRIYIVSGDEEYMRETNEQIEKYYADKESNVKIINCYEINNNNLSKIIEENGYKVVLNTKGENYINNII